MNRSGPIIVIEDDFEDQELLTEVFQSLNFKHKLIFFEDGVSALAYLTEGEVEPFLILSDINMPRLNGIELRAEIHNNEKLRLKCIPYLFFTTGAQQHHVVDAYSKSVQGFFIKPDSYKKLQSTVTKIVEYWEECVSPDYVK